MRHDKSPPLHVAIVTNAAFSSLMVSQGVVGYKSEDLLLVPSPDDYRRLLRAVPPRLQCKNGLILPPTPQSCATNPDECNVDETPWSFDFSYVANLPYPQIGKVVATNGNSSFDNYSLAYTDTLGPLPMQGGYINVGVNRSLNPFAACAGQAVGLIGAATAIAAQVTQNAEKYGTQAAQIAQKYAGKTLVAAVIFLCEILAALTFR